MEAQRIVEDARRQFELANSEAAFRSIASRAYIGTFQHLLRHPRLGRFDAKGTGDDHRDLIEHLKGSSDPMFRRLGASRLPRLRSLRNHADYELGVPFTKGYAAEALEDAEEIVFEWLPNPEPA